MDQSTTELFIYDEIGYWGVTADDLVSELKNVHSDNLTVRINSPGGDVFDGIAILNALRSYDGTVTTIVDGLAASAASFIFQAGAERVVMNNSEIMIHAASGLVIGNATDMRRMAESLDRVTSNIASVYAERAGGDVNSWLAAMDEETWYSADEAVSAGLADRVEGRKSKEPENTFDLSIFAHRGRANAPAPQIDPIEEIPAFDAEAFRKALEEVNYV
ncbi:MAG TPA: head maturation protease, ClpP-related [Terriglobales bacterium]|nr:head maturation protease, ClpP-related [Terriglobales bacterium]